MADDRGIFGGRQSLTNRTYSDCSAVVATPKAKTTIQGPFPDYPSKSLSVEIFLQDDDEHYVKELVVPPNSEIPIQIVLEPRLSFMQHEIYFGCDESLADEKKPRATEYFVPFVREGVRGHGKPDAAHPGHYTDYNGFYHVRENFLYTKDCRVIGFKLQTGATGIYPAQIYTPKADAPSSATLSADCQYRIGSLFAAVLGF